MVFNYMNDPDVWKKFCDTYEAIYDRLGEFDDFYENTGEPALDSPLQTEWKKFMETFLESVVRRSRASFDLMYEKRK